jgi:hypothetical protein
MYSLIFFRFTKEGYFKIYLYSVIYMFKRFEKIIYNHFKNKSLSVLKLRVQYPTFKNLELSICFQIKNII